VNGTLTNSTGDGIANDFLLYNEAEDQWFNVASDENGTFASYVPEGEWLAIVAPFANGNATETLRSPISVASTSDRLELDLQTEVSIEVTMQLKEYITNESLADMTVTAVSHDGFGNITFERTDENGNSTEMMMPGSWSLYLNRTVGTQSWMLDTSAEPFTTDDAVDNILVLDPVYAELEVEIGGKVYWDLNNDSLPSGGEGIPGFNVTLQGTNHSSYSTVVETDEEGVWRAFVPIRDVYNVTVEKQGFDTVYYESENESGFLVHDSPDSRDVEVTAGSVEVVGFITDQLDANRLIDADITLYPVAGIEREPISVTGSMNGSTLEWSMSIQPGDWVVVATEANPDENGGGVAIGLLEASVANGGNITMVMALGGYVDLSTAWTDIEQNEHHAGSASDGATLVQDDVELEVTFDGMSWMVDVPASGQLIHLFPEGSVAFDSEFNTVQHEQALDMEYFGGQTTSVTADSTIAATLTYNRRVNSNLDVTFNEASVGSSATILDAVNSEMEAIVSSTNNSAYTTITFDYDVVYNGTEISDVFTVSGEMGLAQDSDLWTVQVWNASANGGEGAYEDSIELALGVGDNETPAQLIGTVNVQITLPSVEEAWSLENGHRMTVRMETDLGESTQASVKVFVPQTYGFEISDATEEIGMSALVERQFSFDVTNTGNGQDSFTIKLFEGGVLEGWSVTPMTSTLTLSKGETRTQQFTVFAPESFTEGGFDLTVYVNSEDESIDDTVVVSVQAANIKLNVDEGDIKLESDNTANEAGVVRIPVENTGLLDAPSVIVYLEPVSPKSSQELSMTISVPAGEKVVAEFTDLSFAQGNQRFNIRVEVAGPEATSVDSITLPAGESFSLEYFTEVAADGESIWMTLLIVALGFLVIYGGVKTARSRGGSKF